jgi:uncharacterized protein YkwD
MDRAGADGDGLSMRNRRLRSVLRSAAAAGISTVSLALAVASPAVAGTQNCPGADTPTSNVRVLQKTVLCLHNAERGSHGLSKLAWNSDLSNAASKHARDMASRHYFAHLSPAGHDHMDRIAATGYKPAAGCWTAGENLFFSTAGSTPRQMMSAWMHSPLHRQNILRKGWSDFALGVATKSPSGDRHGLTVVALFGTRGGHC